MMHCKMFEGKNFVLLYSTFLEFLEAILYKFFRYKKNVDITFQQRRKIKVPSPDSLFRKVAGLQPAILSIKPLQK